MTYREEDDEDYSNSEKYQTARVETFQEKPESIEENKYSERFEKS